MKTPIKQWSKLEQCSTRLQRILIREAHNWLGIEYIEDITKYDFFRCRQAGIKSWEEFKKLRDEF